MKKSGASFWDTSLRGIKLAGYAVYALFLFGALFFQSQAAFAFDSITITKPSSDSTVTAQQFDVVINYSYGGSETHSIIWEIIKPGNAVPVFVSDPIPAPPGQSPVTIRADLSGQPAGQYVIQAWVFQGTTAQDLAQMNFSTPDPAVSIIHYQPAAPPTTVPTPVPTVEPGAIYIMSDPGDAAIWIEGVYRGNTDFGATYVPFTGLAPDKYSISIRKEGYLNYDKMVELGSNQIVNVDAVLEPGLPTYGTLIIHSDPADARVFIGSFEYSPTPCTFMDIRPGTYELTLKIDGYEDWYDTVTVVAGQKVEVNATLEKAGGFPVVPVVGGAAVLAVAGGLIKVITSRKPALKTPAVIPETAGDPYAQWWANTKPADRNWGNFHTYMTGTMGQPPGGYEDTNGNPSWSSALQSYQNEIKNGQTKSGFGDWVTQHRGLEKQFTQMQAAADKMPQRSQAIIDAEKKYKEALVNVEAQKQVQKVVDYVIEHNELAGFYNQAEHMIVDDNGKVNMAALTQMKGIIKTWEVQKQGRVEPPDYTYINAVKDTASTVGYVVVRGAAAYLTGGLSEVAFAGYTAIQQVEQSMIAGKSDAEAWEDGVKAGTFDLLTGEVTGRALGRIGGWAKNNKTLNRPISSFVKGKPGPSVSAAAKTAKLTQSSPKLAEKMKSFEDKIPGEEMGKYNKDGITNARKVVEVDKTPELKLDDNEKSALDMLLKNGDEIKINAKNLPQKYKDVLASAKQKLFENAQVAGTKNAVNTMGTKANGKTFVGQTTGSAAREGNAAYDPAVSDNDHTINFGDAKVNQAYQKGFNKYIEQQGYDPKALQMNTYGDGIKNTDAYTGTGKQWVDHYNNTSGTDNMVQVNGQGKITISRQTPNKIQSLVSKDTNVPELNKNFTDSFAKKLNDAGDLSNPQQLDQMLTTGSKEVSRTAGKYGGDSIKYFQEKGTITDYQPPPAAKVADLVKNNNMDIDTAMKQAGYSGSKQQLLNDYKKLLNIGGI